jgi:hypothetical protein
MLFDYLKLQGPLEVQAKHFLDNIRQKGILWAQDSIMIFLDFHKERVRKKELAAGTVKNYYRAAKLFCEMNDLTINWKRISKGLPRAKNSSNDRAPTMVEIRKLVEYPDRRIKPIVYAMASGGLRLGGWDYLQWKHYLLFCIFLIAYFLSISPVPIFPSIIFRFPFLNNILLGYIFSFGIFLIIRNYEYLRVYLSNTRSSIMQAFIGNH